MGMLHASHFSLMLTLPDPKVGSAVELPSKLWPAIN